MPDETVDVLAIGAHPDDVELTVGGTILACRARGRRVAIVHMTGGEMGTRGSPETRAAEARDAADALGVESMEILGLPDGHVMVDDTGKDAVIRILRRYRPRLVLAPWVEDLHPDHAMTGRLVVQAMFLAGLEKWDTGQRPWRPERILQYSSHTGFEPDLVVDISKHLEAKRDAARCYLSQFHRADSDERQTYIAREEFWDWWEARAMSSGQLIGVRYGEAFRVHGILGVDDPVDLVTGFTKYHND